MGQSFDSIIKGFFWRVYNGNLEAWGERNNSLYLTNRKLAEFVDGEVNFISILADCSSTARADCFFNLFVHLCDDRNNRKMPTCCFSGVWLISTISGSQIFITEERLFQASCKNKFVLCYVITTVKVRFLDSKRFAQART